MYIARAPRRRDYLRVLKMDYFRDKVSPRPPSLPTDRSSTQARNSNLQAPNEYFFYTPKPGTSPTNIHTYLPVGGR